MKTIKRGHKKKIMGIVLAAILCIAAAVTIFFMGRGQKKQPEKGMIRENTIQLAKMDLTNSISATGTIKSADTKTVNANVTSADVKKVRVKEGDTVKKGDILAEFDKTDLQASYEEAWEDYNDTKAQTARESTSAKRKLSEAQDTYTSQKKAYKKNVKSAKTTYQTAKKTVAAARTGEEKEKAKQELEKAKQAYEQAVEEQKNGNKQNTNNISDAKDSVKNTESNNKKSLREAKNKLDDAKELLSQCKVKASMSGVVTAVGVEEGSTYTGGDMFEISDCDHLIVSTTISEYDIANIKKGQKAVILTNATDETEIIGKITYTAMTMGSSLSSTGNSEGSSAAMSSQSTSSSGYEVKIELQDVPEAVRVGMTAKCSIILDEAEDVYAVPYDAIHTNSDGDSVIYTLDQGTGTRQEITVTKGLESDYYVEITGDDLSDELNVIIPTDSTADSDTTEESGKDDAAFEMPGGMNGGGMGGRPDGMGGGRGGQGVPQ